MLRRVEARFAELVDHASFDFGRRPTQDEPFAPFGRDAPGRPRGTRAGKRPPGIVGVE